MRFMIIRKADANTEAGAMPGEALIKEMTDYNERLIKAGVMKDGDGLKPSSAGVRVKFHAGRPKVTDGPFAETRELVAGYSIFECASLAEAVEWVSQWPKSDADGEVEIEIRPFVTAEDFGEAFTDELREREDALRTMTNT